MPEAPYRVYLCGGPHCTARGGVRLRERLEGEVWEHALEATVEVRSSGCQDRCADGPNLIVWPGPYRYGHLCPAAIVEIVTHHLQTGEPVVHRLARCESSR